MDSADEREAEAEVTCCLQKEFQKADSRPFATADAKDGGGAGRCFGAVKLMNRRWLGCEHVFSGVLYHLQRHQSGHSHILLRWCSAHIQVNLKREPAL